MGLRTKRGGDDLPSWLLVVAEDLVGRLDPSQQSRLYRLASNARQGILLVQEWESFDSIIRHARIDPQDRNHAPAVMLALMPKILTRERSARTAAVREARERLKKASKEKPLSRSVKFGVSTESSTSINRGAERFPWHSVDLRRSKLGTALAYYRVTLGDVLEAHRVALVHSGGLDRVHDLSLIVRWFRGHTRRQRQVRSDCYRFRRPNCNSSPSQNRSACDPVRVKTISPLSRRS